MAIETLDDWNERLAACGCCAMPTCPLPIQECENVKGFVSMPGWFHDGKRWSKKITENVVLPDEVTTDTSYNIWDGFGFVGGGTTGAEYESERVTYSTDAKSIEEYDPIFEKQVIGREQCSYSDAVYSKTCSGGATKTTTNRMGAASTIEGGGFNYYTPITSVTTETWTYVAGQETDEHAAWVAEWVDQETWQAAYDQWVIDHAAWKVDKDAYDAAYAQWVEDFNTWDEGGQIGDPPVEPDPFVDPEPEEPPAEPDEFYDECTWRRTTVIQGYDITLDGGVVSTPLDPVTTTEIVFFLSDLPGGAFPEVTYELETKVEDARPVLDAIIAAADMDECAARLGDFQYSSCRAYYEVLNPSSLVELLIEGAKVRYRWILDPQIIYEDDGPDEDEYPDIDTYWTGTYFKITWDVLTEPDGWDETINDPEETLPDPLPEGYDTPEEWWADHQVPKPGRPNRTYIKDLTWEWTGPADPEDPSSWRSDWYDLEVPPEAGNRRVVNVRYECYRSPYGNKPEVTGEGVDYTEEDVDETPP